MCQIIFEIVRVCTCRVIISPISRVGAKSELGSVHFADELRSAFGCGTFVCCRPRSDQEWSRIVQSKSVRRILPFSSGPIGQLQ